MRAIKEARKLIERKPDDASAKTLSRLVLALESEADFPITDLYLLESDKFKLALEILDEWRLDRHYASKARLFDVSMQMSALKSQEAKAAKDGKAKDDKEEKGKGDNKVKEDKEGKIKAS